MAIYYPTVENTNYIGGVTSQVEIIEPNATAIGYNEFVKQATTYNLMLDNIDIVSFDNNLVQVQQPITINYVEPDGRKDSIVHAPSVSSNAFNARINNLSLKKPFLFNGASSIDYPVLAGSTVILTIKAADKAAEKKTGKKTFYDNDLGHDEITYREAVEPEEMKKLVKAKGKGIYELKEPGEDKKKAKKKGKIVTILLEDVIPEIKAWDNDAAQAIKVSKVEEVKDDWIKDADEAIKAAKIKKRKPKVVRPTIQVEIKPAFDFMKLVWKKVTKVKKIAS